MPASAEPVHSAPAVPPAAPSPDRAWRRSLRVRLLVTVNAVALIGLALWLVVDYRRDLSQRLDDTRAALGNEARALAPLILQVHRTDPDAIQARIDEVCVSMRTEDSPDHHIVARVDGRTYESASHAGSTHPHAADRGSPLAPAPGANGGTTPAPAREASVAGRFDSQGVSVEVSKSAAAVMRRLNRLALERVSFIAAGAAVIALVANLILVRLVSRPLDRLVASVRAIAAGTLGAAPERFNTAELDFLSWEVGQMSSALAAAEKDRRAQLAKARRIQEHLSPTPTNLAGLELAALHQPADNVAGDYYDALPLADGAYLVCVADVTGHGVPAAMGAAMLKVLVLDACEGTSDPAEVLTHINRRFAEVSLDEDFASMFVALVRPGSDEIAYASAGHEQGYIVRHSAAGAERFVTLPPTGMLLGLKQAESQWHWETRRAAVRPGDCLLLVTDGVTEAFDGGHRQFGRRRLQSLLQTAPAGVEPLLRAVQDALSRHTAGTAAMDDVTVVAVALDSVMARARAVRGAT